MGKLVIIGCGMAGYSVAREFRKLNSTTSICMITADSGDFYSKPMLSNALGQGKNSQSLITTTREKMEQQLNANIYPHAGVTAIDVNSKIVTFEQDDGVKEIPYQQLVLALGAHQRPLNVSGSGAHDVLTINNLEQYARFESCLSHSRRITIIGSGLIGCEFANDIVGSGRKVEVVGSAVTPLSNLLPQAAGSFFQQKLAAQGVQWRNSARVTRVDKVGPSYQVTLSDGDTLETDLVLSAIGLSPNIQLAQTSGLKINKGIVVDSFLRTSIDDVYALGDCAEISGLVLAYILPIMHSARALAKTLSGEESAVSFPVMPVVVKTPAHAVVVSVPPLGAQGDWHIKTNPNGVEALYTDSQGKLLGYALTGSEVNQKQQLNKQLPWVLPPGN